MNSSDIARKLESFAHQELNNEKYKDGKWIQECITRGIDLFRRKYVKIEKFNCRKLGLPLCDNCSLVDEPYNVLKLASNEKCLRAYRQKVYLPSKYVKYMYLEYRHWESGVRIVNNTLPFDFLKRYEGIEATDQRETSRRHRVKRYVRKRGISNLRRLIF